MDDWGVCDLMQTIEKLVSVAFYRLELFQIGQYKSIKSIVVLWNNKESQNLHVYNCNHMSEAETANPYVTQVLILYHVLVMSLTRARVFTLHLRMVLLITGSKRGCYPGEWLICEVPVQPWYRTY